MRGNQKVIVMLKCGKALDFYVRSFEDYEALVSEVEKFWFKWITIGHTVSLRKKSISGVFYVGDNGIRKKEHQETCDDDEL